MTAARALAIVPDPADATEWESWRRQWSRSLATENKSERTIAAYDFSLLTLQRWALAPLQVVSGPGEPVEIGPYNDGEPFESPLDLSPADLRAFQQYRLKRTTNRGTPASPAGVRKDHRQLRVFFGWLVEIDELDASPLQSIKAPKVVDKLIDVIPDDDARKLLDACKGRDFTARRDTAIIRLLLDTGIRRDELVTITLDKLDTADQSAVVTGKGSKTRTVTYGAKTANAIDAYLRARSRHADRRQARLWLAHPDRRGVLLGDGVTQMLTRRAREAGVTNIHPHRFRHTAADRRLAAGMTEGDAMRFFGWESRSMLDRYGRSAAGRRAVAASRKYSPADEI